MSRTDNGGDGKERVGEERRADRGENEREKMKMNSLSLR